LLHALLASCVFLLDYDELQSARPPKAAARAGPPQQRKRRPHQQRRGGWRQPSACGDCNDHDACTVDTCDETGAPRPACTSRPRPEARRLRNHVARRPLRARLTGSQRPALLLAALRYDKGVPRVSLHRLASDGTELEAVGTDLKLEGTPVSNVGLAVEELAVGDVALHGFLAAKPKLGDLAPKVFHLVNHAGKTTSNLVGMAYKADNETVFPQALSMAARSSARGFNRTARSPSTTLAVYAPTPSAPRRYRPRRSRCCRRATTSRR